MPLFQANILCYKFISDAIGQQRAVLFNFLYNYHSVINVLQESMTKRAANFRKLSQKHALLKYFMNSFEGMRIFQKTLLKNDLINRKWFLSILKLFLEASTRYYMAVILSRYSYSHC